MASPDTPQTETRPEKLAPEVQLEVTRLRSIMYEYACVRLVTSDADDGRWLTDMYVMLNVTNSPAVAGLEDGCYKLTAGKGLVPLCWEPDGLRVIRPAELDLDAYFARLVSAEWRPVKPSQWSAAEHPGKAMLFSASDEPALMGEETWKTLHRHYEEPSAEHDAALNTFRILSGDMVVAYVAGIQVPDGQEGIAKAIAELNSLEVSTSNYESQSSERVSVSSA